LAIILTCSPIPPFFPVGDIQKVLDESSYGTSVLFPVELLAVLTTLVHICLVPVDLCLIGINGSLVPVDLCLVLINPVLVRIHALGEYDG